MYNSFPSLYRGFLYIAIRYREVRLYLDISVLQYTLYSPRSILLIIIFYDDCYLDYHHLNVMK